MKKKILIFVIMLTLVTGCGDKPKEVKDSKKEKVTTTTVASTAETKKDEKITTTVAVSDNTTNKTTKEVKTTATKATTAGKTTKAETPANPVPTTTTTTVKTTSACDLKFNGKCYKVGDTITIDFVAKTDLNVEDFRIRTIITGKGANSYESLDPVGVNNPYMSSGTTADVTDTGFEGFAWIRMNGESLSGGKKIYTLKFKVLKAGEFTIKSYIDSAMDRESNDIGSSSISLSSSVK